MDDEFYDAVLREDETSAQAKASKNMADDYGSSFDLCSHNCVVSGVPTLSKHVVYPLITVWQDSFKILVVTLYTLVCKVTACYTAINIGLCHSVQSKQEMLLLSLSLSLLLLLFSLLLHREDE